eukprot:1109630-Pelagomonas_calceolata.AAC.9
MSMVARCLPLLCHLCLHSNNLCRLSAGRIEHSDEQKRKKIDGWVASVNAIHKEKPPATVSYLRKMPDIETLMQVGKGQKKGKEIRWDLCHADDLHHSPPMQKLTYVD